ncbi:MAG TPA: hypothetical protein VGM59_16560 [Dongiaceae bacterium]
MDMGLEDARLKMSSSAIEPPSREPAPTIDALDHVLRDIGEASRATEGAFVGIGGRLETSISTLERLTATFDQLLLGLGSEEMLRATEALSRVADRIAALAGMPNEAWSVLERISGLTEVTTGHVARMHKAVKAVGLLAVNAKIEAAHITTNSQSFSSFAEEIVRALKTAQENLNAFAADLTGMSGELGKATAGQRELGLRQDQAIRTIPGQLAGSVTAIAARRRQAEITVADIQKKTLEVGQRVGSAVMAMQIGDTTRQRIEHTEFALDLMRGVFGHRGAATDFDCSGLSAEDRETLLATVCALEAAQLSDSAQELDGQVGQIVNSLRELAADARDIATLGQQTYASGGYRAGSFLSELKEDVSKAQALLEDLRTAQTAGDQVMVSVLATTKMLVRNISAIQSLEADIRIMGLNTTLRCGRLGTEGKPLTVIAQELRACSNLTATEAEAIMADLDSMVAAASSATEQKAESAVAETTDLSAIMSASVDLLSGIADSLTDALDILDRESHAVAKALEQTAAEIGANLEIGATLRRAVTRLEEFGRPDETDQQRDSDIHQRIFSAIARTYTMARERDIHSRIVAGSEMPTETAAPTSAGSSEALDDIFF